MFPNPWHSESIDKPDSTIALYELICIGIRSWRSHVEVVGRHLQFCQQSWMNTTDIFLKNPKGGIWLRPVINFNTSFTKKSHSGIPKNRIKYSPDCKNLKIYTKHCLIMSLGELSDYVSRWIVWLCLYGNIYPNDIVRIDIPNCIQTIWFHLASKIYDRFLNFIRICW